MDPHSSNPHCSRVSCITRLGWDYLVSSQAYLARLDLTLSISFVSVLSHTRSYLHADQTEVRQKPGTVFSYAQPLKPLSPCEGILVFAVVLSCLNTMPQLVLFQRQQWGPTAMGIYFNTGFLPGLCHLEPGLHLLQNDWSDEEKRRQQLQEEWIVRLPILPGATQACTGPSSKGLQVGDSASHGRRGELKGRKISMGRKTCLREEKYSCGTKQTCSPREPSINSPFCKVELPCSKGRQDTKPKSCLWSRS